MKIVTWNCKGNFSNKFRHIKGLDADVYVIQECENPADSNDWEYRNFSRNCLWVGHHDMGGTSRGLGIFIKEGHTIIDNLWSVGNPGYYISCKIDDTFNILGVWAYNDENGCYAPGVLRYMIEHRGQLGPNYVIAGDLNLNENINGLRKSSKNQTKETFYLLNSIGLVSAYHKNFNESHGDESRKTFYRGNKPSTHIDYIFADKTKINSVELLNPDVWIRSGIDHLPLLAELK